MKRKLGWFGLGFAGAELAAAILPPLVCVPAAAFLVCLALLWIKRRRDSAIPVLGALCGLAWFLVFTLVWVQPVKALAGQTVTCTAVVETDADASYSESRLRGTLRLTEIDGRAANVKVQCASFPGESAGERFTAKFALTELPDNKYRLSRQSKGVYLQAEYLGSYHPLDASRAPRFALYRLRQRWSATLRRWLPRQLDGIEAAMLLADKSRLDDSVQQAFRTAGVSHLLAVSGLHLALLCGLLGFGRKWKFYKPLILLRAAAALFYLLLTGMPVSVSRAGIVLLVALVGDFFLLPPDLLTSTSFAAILLGLQNAYAPCDLGFQLMYTYDRLFGQYNHTVAQMLLTWEDFDHENRLHNLQNTLERLLQLHAIPIINENDPVACEEYSLGDNDTLAALVAKCIHADLVVLMSDIDGLYTADPHTHPDAKLIPVVEEITPEIELLAGGAGSALGTGGMLTKVTAAKRATEAGVDMIITNGAHAEVLYDIVEGKPVGTRFVGRKA